MKPNLALLLLLLPLTTVLNARDNEFSPDRHDSDKHEKVSTASTTLAGQLRDIAGSTTMSRKSQEKLITSAVRLAVTAAVQGTNDPAKALKIALELAVSAGKAAPQFAEEIAEAIKNAPAISHIKGASREIIEAVHRGRDESDNDDTDTAHPDRDNHHKHDGKGDHDFGGHCDDPVVSPSGPHHTSGS